MAVSATRYAIRYRSIVAVVSRESEGKGMTVAVLIRTSLQETEHPFFGYISITEKESLTTPL
jgi:hypothetical protein